jgi:hypothetical protein
VNPSKCSRLASERLSGTWFRAIPPRFWRTSLQTSHTRNVLSRFSPGPAGNPAFEILYLCENGTIALEEVGAQFRHPTSGRVFTSPVPTLIVNVDVSLQYIVDLTDVSQQRLVRTNAQELTGDWRAYSYRQPSSSVPRPVGVAPTQMLGQALFNSPSLEGFLVMSAKLPDHRNLIVFPQKLAPGSTLRFVNPLTNDIHVVSP